MLHENNSLLTDVLQEIIYTESIKKSLSQEILLEKDEAEKQKLIYQFLNYDLDKHFIMEQAAMLAMENNEHRMFQQLELFYKHADGDGLLAKIRAEIAHDKLFLETIEKAIDDFHVVSFVERRLIKEINKYVMTQARYYCKIPPGLS